MTAASAGPGVRLPEIPLSARAAGYVSAYGGRWDRDRIALASSSFLKRSPAGSQNTFLFNFMAMW